MKNKNGFTLIELLAVVVILGILSSIALIAVTRVKHRQDIENVGNMINGVLTGAKEYESNNGLSDTDVDVDTLISSGYVDISDDKYNIFTGKSVSYEMCGTESLKRQFIIEIKEEKFTDCGCEEQTLDDESTKICIYGATDTKKENVTAAIEHIIK